MLIDDRLATVLRAAVTGDAAARTQLRQLIDLLGSLAQEGRDAPEAAYGQLEMLLDRLPPAQAAAILTEQGLRLRNARLVALLAEAGPQVAAAAMAAARLEDGEWTRLIPRLPIIARGFLRHRRDLPAGARAMLERLGVRDLVLTAPADYPAASPVPPPASDAGQGGAPHPGDEDAGTLLRRIEAFRNARQAAGLPRLPLSDGDSGRAEAVDSFDFSTDGNGSIVWADKGMAPFAVGLMLGVDRAGAVAVMGRADAAAMRHRLPLRGVTVEIDAAPPITGRWTMDAAPHFDGSGAFSGHCGRMRRVIASPEAELGPAAAEADRIRQLLHELRTPVNAIQGFAEVIQQQVFGPAPNEYRALAAAVAVDAARMMAGFDELERLARLELRDLALSPGSSDLRHCVGDTLRRLEGAIRPRGAAMDLRVAGAGFHVPLDEAEILQLVWRLLATLAGALGPGEAIGLTLESDGAQIALRADLPRSLNDEDDLFAATAPAQAQTLSAGAFGSGFALRLARAEAIAAGGALHRVEEFVELVLPSAAGHVEPADIVSR